MFLKKRKRPERPENVIQSGVFPLSFKDVKWRAYKEGDPIPENAFKICEIESGEEAYACRGDIQHNKIPGFFLTSTQLGYFAYGCTEHIKSRFEIMIVDDTSCLKWVDRQDGDMEINDYPVVGGINYGSVEELYIGKTCTSLRDGKTYQRSRIGIPEYVNTAGKSRPGKIHRSHRCLYVPYSTLEYIYPRYLMLVYKPSPARLSHICTWKILQQLQLYGRNKIEFIDNLPLPERLKNKLKEYKC